MEEADERKEEEADEWREKKADGWREEEADGWRKLYFAFYTLSLRFGFDYDVQTLTTLKN